MLPDNKSIKQKITHLVASKEILEDIIIDLNIKLGLPRNGTTTYGVPEETEVEGEYKLQVDESLYSYFNVDDLNKYGF